jgi:hypothetical protein
MRPTAALAGHAAVQNTSLLQNILAIVPHTLQYPHTG